MIAGSLLGAVRHSGIIPWDDDMDFGMLRKDFEKFIEACSKDLDRDKFILQTDMNDKNYPFNFAKIRLKNTEILEEFSSDGNSEKGIFIDIFPFDNVPQNNIDRKFFYSSLYVIKNLLWVKLNYGDSERKKSLSYKVAKLLVKVISVSFLKKLKKKILSRSNGEITTKITTCDGNYGLKKETIDRSLTEKLIMFDVDGHQFPSFLEVCENPKKIKAIFLKNNGVSRARNKGIEMSNGDYIFFMDGDDYISSTYIENLVRPFMSNDNDICMTIGNFQYDYEQQNFFKKMRSSKFQIKCSANELINNLSSSAGGGFVWNKLFRKDLLIIYNLRFNENIKILEDFLFVTEFLNISQSYSVGISEDYGYFYFQRSTRALHSNKIETSKVVALNKILNIAQEYPKLKYKILSDYVNVIVSISFYAEQTSRKQYIKVYKEIKKLSGLKVLTLKHKIMLAMGLTFPHMIPLLNFIKKLYIK